MQKPKLNYIELVRQLWICQKENSLSPIEIAVYFYLLEVCNTFGWKNPFQHSNGYLCSCLNISERTLQTARNTLKQVGLIEFKSGSGRRNFTEYKIRQKKYKYNFGNQIEGTESFETEEISVSAESEIDYIEKGTEKVTEKVTERVQERLPKGSQKGSNNYHLYFPNLLENQEVADPLKLKQKLKQKNSEEKENLVKEKSEYSPQELMFDDGRKIFPGTKRGLETEFTNFRKKHTDWKDVVELIKPAIDAEIEYKKQLKTHGQFVPEWKNFQTWINQRCWEQEFSELSVNNSNGYNNGTASAAGAKGSQYRRLDWFNGKK